MKVSIIIRSKNEEKWIGLCLESIFSQSYEDFEVIVVDNNSTDGTVKKAKNWPVKLLKIDKFKYEVVLMVQPTTPLRTPKIVKD